MNPKPQKTVFYLVLALLVAASLVIVIIGEGSGVRANPVPVETGPPVSTVAPETETAPASEPATQAEVAVMSNLPPAELTLEKVSHLTRSAGQPVLVLQDGSEKVLTPYVVSQLPSEVRFRVEYNREH